jgi:hypothetical protein
MAQRWILPRQQRRNLAREAKMLHEWKVARRIAVPMSGTIAKATNLTVLVPFPFMEQE